MGSDLYTNRKQNRGSRRICNPLIFSWCRGTESNRRHADFQLCPGPLKTKQLRRVRLDKPGRNRPLQTHETKPGRNRESYLRSLQKHETAEEIGRCRNRKGSCQAHGTRLRWNGGGSLGTSGIVNEHRAVPKKLKPMQSRCYLNRDRPVLTEDLVSGKICPYLVIGTSP